MGASGSTARRAPHGIRYERRAAADVADQIDRIGAMPAQEFDQPVAPAGPRAEMDIREEERAQAALLLQHLIVDLCARHESHELRIVISCLIRGDE
jgi:hypothetical protein